MNLLFIQLGNAVRWDLLLKAGRIIRLESVFHPFSSPTLSLFTLSHEVGKVAWEWGK